VETVSSLAREYSGRTGLRTFGVLVCEEVTDRLLSLKGLKDAEVVYTLRGRSASKASPEGFSGDL